MAQKFKQGDKVEWQVGSGTTTGTIQRRVTESTKVDGQAVNASNDDPRYLVKNDSTGKITGHTPDTLNSARHGAGQSKDGNQQNKNQDSESGLQMQRDGVQEKIREFEEAVNMPPHEIENWLETDNSKSVGQEDESGHIKGRLSGKHIVEILRKNKADYTKSDFQRMKKVVSYVHRHLAQEPSGDINRDPLALLTDELGPRSPERLEKISMVGLTPYSHGPSMGTGIALCPSHA
jgi:ribosomal protein L11